MAFDFDDVPKYVQNEIVPPKKASRINSKGMAVQRIQEWLRFHNFDTVIDADFGPATRQCVKDFQKSRGMNPSGIVNRATWEELVEPMINALESPKIEKNETVGSTIINVATQHLEQGALEIGGDNRGPWVRLYCGGNDGSEWPWCAGFVTLVFQQAYFYRKEKPPITGSVSCDTLAHQATMQDLFIKGDDVKKSKIDWKSFGHGCLFLLRKTEGDWIHTGIAFDGAGKSEELVFTTIEGNTNEGGSRNGFKAARRTRSLSKRNYDFIRFPV